MKLKEKLETTLKKRGENYYLIKYPIIGWVIDTPEHFTTDNFIALDFKLFNH